MDAPQGLAFLQNHYQERGFAVCDPGLPPEILTETRSALQHIQDQSGTLPPALAEKITWEKDLPDAKRGGIRADGTGNAIFLVGDLPAFSLQLSRVIIAPLLLEMVSSLLGTKDIRYHFSNLTSKSRFVGSGISWHRDFPNRYLCPSGSSFLRLMICVDGMSADNGATEFVLNSHKISDTDALVARADQDAARPGARLHTATCPPGSLVFIHPKVIHGGAPNTSPRWRRNIVVQWGRADDPIAKTATETLAGFSVPEIQSWIASQQFLRSEGGLREPP